jgi:hypothetical protein
MSNFSIRLSEAQRSLLFKVCEDYEGGDAEEIEALNMLAGMLETAEPEDSSTWRGLPPVNDFTA